MLKTNLIKNELNNLIKHNQRSISFFGFGKKKTEKPELIEDEDALIEQKVSVWDHLTQEEIESIQNKSNLTTKQRDRLHGKLSQRVVLTELYQYKTEYVRNLYAQFGKETGLKPGVCFPRKEELAFKMKYEDLFNPPLEQLLKELQEDKAREAAEIKEREDEIKKNLKNLDKYKKEFFKKYNKVQSEIKEKEDKEQKRIEEVCDFLGYKLSPTDPRFEAAAEKKAEIERKEQMKSGAVRKTRHMRMLEELQQLIEKNQQKEDNEKNKDDKVEKKEDDKVENKEDLNDKDTKDK